MPRSLAFCVSKMSGNLDYLREEYGSDHPCFDKMKLLRDRLKGTDIDQVFDTGLHEFIVDFLDDNAELAAQIEEDFRFNG